MLVLQILLSMLSISDYLQHAKSQSRQLHSVEGIVIYDPGMGSLPQDILFLPGKWDKKGSLEDFITKKVGDKEILYQVYFQGIRWIMFDVEKILHSSKFTEIKIGKPLRNVNVTYAELIFDKTINVSNEEIIDTRDRYLPISVHGKNSNIQLIDLPDSYGTLKIYKPIMW